MHCLDTRKYLVQQFRFFFFPSLLLCSLAEAATALLSSFHPAALSTLGKVGCKKKGLLMFAKPVEAKCR